VSHGSEDTATVLFSGDISAPRLGPARRLLNDWATAQGLDADTVYAITLSGYEALANTVEHAYREQGRGPVELRAHRHDDLVTVIVCDHGQWRPPATEPQPRGRGLMLIHGLGTHADVHQSPTGTTITMTWQLAPPPRDF
jgi:anti-sigma regulatory factor (Ser/Thr protein kinase)